MKKTFKKVLVTVLTVSLILGTFSFTAFAGNCPEIQISTEITAENQVENMGDGDTIGTETGETETEKTYIVTNCDGTSYVVNEDEADYILEGIIAESEADHSTTMESSYAPEAVPDLGTVVASGQCGDSVNWALNSEGTMHIYGTGTTWDYRENDVLVSRPWDNYTQSITSVVFHEGVTNVGTSMFENTVNLQHVTFADTITAIENFAFMECRQLENVVLPPRLLKIGQEVFRFNEKITEITIPGTVCFIDVAFAYCQALKTVYYEAGPIQFMINANSPCRCCYSLENIEVSQDHFCLFSDNGVLFLRGCELYDGRQSEGNLLLQYPLGRKDENYTVPEGTAAIGQMAFEGSVYLKNVYIADSVISIATLAFADCTQSLKKVYIGEGVEIIGEGAFGSCWNVTEIIMHSNVKTIEKFAFKECRSLTSIEIPTGVTSIEAETFYDCFSLTSIEIPTSITSIGEGAFYNCISLKSIKIPAGVTNIGANVFECCECLKEIIINPDVKTVGKCAFKDCKVLADVYYTGTEADRENISIYDGNEILTNATWHYNNSGAFTDVYKQDWFCDSVLFVKDRGIMTGQGGTDNFAPAQLLQRQEFANMLWRLAGEPSAAYEAKFPDVPDGTWFTTPIMWAYKNGVITGYASGNFGVGDNVTREQFATMLYRYAKEIAGIEMTGVVDISSYPDAENVSPWALDAIQWAVGNGIITGKQGKYLDPTGNATRCEGAAMIQRFMEKYGL